MTATRTAVPQPPRLDVGLILILTTMLVAGATFFGACSSAVAMGEQQMLQLHDASAASPMDDAELLDVEHDEDDVAASSPAQVMAFQLNTMRSYLDDAGLHTITSGFEQRHALEEDRGWVAYAVITSAAAAGGFAGACVALLVYMWISQLLHAHATSVWLKHQRGRTGPDVGVVRSSPPQPGAVPDVMTS